MRGVRTHLTVWLHAGQLNSLPTGICVGVRLCHDSRLDACAEGKGARALLQGSASEAGGLCTRTRSSPQNARHLCRGGRRNAAGERCRTRSGKALYFPTVRNPRSRSKRQRKSGSISHEVGPFFFCKNFEERRNYEELFSSTRGHFCVWARSL